MRSISEPFVVTPPTAASIRTRLRLSAWDEAVLRAVGEHLGRLAGHDLAVRCWLGVGDNQWAERKRALTPESSARWAGTITRTSNDQWQRGRKNQLDERERLRRACRTIRARLKVPAGKRQGGVRGYASRDERFQKQRRLQALEARLAQVEARIEAGRVSLCRGGRRLAKLRHALDHDSVVLTGTQWRELWGAERLFLSADGQADAPWGNQTIRVHPEEHWLQIRLPTALAHLSNMPGRVPTYRLSCPVVFNHRAAEWAAQAASGAVAYTVWLNAERRRWYVDASWRLPPRPVPSLEELRRHPAFAIDLNADHLAGWVLNPAGNPLGPPRTTVMELEGRPGSTRDARLRAAVAEVLRLAVWHGCRAILVEDLNFTDARHIGRETLGRGKHGKRFRRIVTGIPTHKFRDLLVGMATNAGLWVVAVDPAYTSIWGGRYWQQPLSKSTKPSVTVSRHHAAAAVIGRRGLGYRARRRGWCAWRRPEDRQQRATDSAGQPETSNPLSGGLGVVPGSTAQGPGGPGGQRAGPQTQKTRLPEPDTAGDQAAQDRSVPPVSDGS